MKSTKTIGAAALAILSFFVAPSASLAQTDVPSWSGFLPDGGTGVASPGTPVSGFPDYAQLVRDTHQRNINLYRQWLERERIRYILTYSSNAAEVQHFWTVQAAIEHEQLEYITTIHTYFAQWKRALITNYAGDPLLPQYIQTLQNQYTPYYQNYLALKGLRQSKFAGLPQLVIASPETDSSIEPWLYWLHAAQ